MNPRNLIYRQKKGDAYPTRQLDVMTMDGTRTPLTKNPCTDNIWSRFSPGGDRIAYYRRRIIDEKALEYAVISSTDGSNVNVVLCFTEYGESQGLPWFRPDRAPAWSPDGEMLCWLVSTNDKPSSEGESQEIVLVSTRGRVVRRIALSKLGLERVTCIDWN